MRYELTDEAEADLAQIVDYIAQQSPRSALKVFDSLHEAMRNLAQFPGMGHRRYELSDEPVLFWKVYSYLIVYRAERKPLHVLRIIHGARDLRAILGKTEP